jgi:hypothetical protein
MLLVAAVSIYARTFMVNCTCDPGDPSDAVTQSLLTQYGASAQLGDILDILDTATLTYVKWKLERRNNHVQWRAVEQGVLQVAANGQPTGGGFPVNGGFRNPAWSYIPVCIGACGGIVEVGPIQPL